MSEEGTAPIDPEPTDPTDQGEAFAEVAVEIAADRRRVSALGEIREVVFGAQDGLVSTLAVVATVAGATTEPVTVLIAGLASAVAGVFSMSVGEYLGSRSQEEVLRWHVDDERREVRERPAEAVAEVAYLFTTEGMSEEDAWATARTLERYPRSLLATMVAKELGIVHDESETSGSPLRGAVVMGSAFAAGAIVPLAPFAVLEGRDGVAVATLATAVVLFLIGAAKTRWTSRGWLRSGLEVVALAAVAGIAGYLLGTALPTLLGVEGVI